MSPIFCHYAVHFKSHCFVIIPACISPYICYFTIILSISFVNISLIFSPLYFSLFCHYFALTSSFLSPLFVDFFAGIIQLFYIPFFPPLFCHYFTLSQPAIACSKLTKETLEQDEKYQI